MAIADRIDKALQDLRIGDFENALIQISIAIDATGKKRKSKSGVGERCRYFIKENEDFIYHFVMDGRLKVEKGGRIMFGGGELGQVLYKSARCALLHEGDISNSVVFERGFKLGQKENKFIITDNMLFGLLLTIVGEPKNSNETMKNEHSISYKNKNIEINKYWGKLEQLKTLTEYKKFPNKSFKPTP